jgi:prefoldin subunit 5
MEEVKNRMEELEYQVDFYKEHFESNSLEIERLRAENAELKHELECVRRMLA